MPSRLALVLVLASYALLALGHNLVVPPGESPDEPTHLEYVYHLRTERTLPRLAQPGGTGIVQGGHPPLYYALAAALGAWAPARPVRWELNPYFSFNFAQPPAANRYLHVLEPGFPYRGSPELAAIHVMRLVSLLATLVTLWATYALAATVWPRRPCLAWGSAAVAAFVPGVAFSGGVFNNDSLATAFASLALLMTVRVALGHAGRLDLALLGTALGLGIMTKMTTASLALVAALGIGAHLWRTRDVRVLPRAIACTGGSVLALAGWWIARNVRLYGSDDPMGWQAFVRAGQDILRTVPIGDEIWWYWYLQFTSFWGSFGWTTVRMPAPLYQAYGALLVAALLGLALQARRWRSIDADSRWGLALLLAAVVLGYASVFRLFLEFSNVVAHGRYLYPILAPLAVLLATGVAQLVPQRWRPRTLGALAAALLAVSAACLLLLVRPAFRLPTVSNPARAATHGTAVDAAFDGRFRLARYALSSQRLTAGQSIEVTLYWQRSWVPGQPRPSVDDPEIRFVHILGADGEVIARLDSPPFDGTLPTFAFRPGDLYREDLRLDIDPDAVTGSGTILVGWYPESDPFARLPVAVDGRPVGDVYRIEHVVVQPARPSVPDPARTTPRADRLGDPPVASLLGYALDGAFEPGQVVTLTLYWRADAPVGADPVVFVHLAGPDGTTLATADGRPQQGRYPMWLWTAGETVADAHALALPARPPPGSTLRVGWYDAGSGTRTPAWQGDGNPWPEAAVVLELPPRPGR